MKKNNEINDMKLKKDLACEKLSHISDLLKYKFSLNTTNIILKREYSIYIEDEGICFEQKYSIDEIIACNVDIEARKLRRGFCMCVALDEIKEYEERKKGN